MRGPAGGLEDISTEMSFDGVGLFPWGAARR